MVALLSALLPLGSGAAPGAPAPRPPESGALQALQARCLALPPPERAGVAEDLLGCLPLWHISVRGQLLTLADGSARERFGDGWAAPGQFPGSRTAFLTARGPRSTFRFWHYAPLDRPLTLRATLAARTPGTRGRIKAVLALNGAEVGSWLIGEEQPTEHQLVLPGSTLRRGGNVVEVNWWRVGPAGETKPANNVDEPASLYRLLLEEPGPGWPERWDRQPPWDLTELAGGRFAARIEASHRAVWHVLVPPGGVLDLSVGYQPGDGATPGKGKVDARIYAEGATGEQVLLAKLTRSPSALAKDPQAWRLDLGRFAGQPLRLIFEADYQGFEPQPGTGLCWIRPLLYTAAQAESGPVAAPLAGRARDYNLVIFLLDALRADGLSCFGGRAGISPQIDRLAADGVLLEDLQAQSSWTRPSVASFFSGTYPARNGAISLSEVLDAKLPLLPEKFDRAGYATAGFMCNAAVGFHGGFERGFDLYRSITNLALPLLRSMPGLEGRAAEVERLSFSEVAAWLKANQVRWSPGKDKIATRLFFPEVEGWIRDHAGEKFFLYLHNWHPHSPYLPAAKTVEWLDPGYTGPADGTDATLQNRRLIADCPPRDLEHIKALYQGEIYETDQLVGELRRLLAELGIEQETIFLVLSDHGEQFLEHGDFLHGRYLYDELIKVPLVAACPGLFPAGRRVPAPLQSLDLAPTLAELFGLPPEPHYQGTSFLPLLSADRPVTPRLRFAEFHSDAQHLSSADFAPYKCLRKVVRPPRGASRETVVYELYDRSTDPKEQQGLWGRQPFWESFLRDRLLFYEWHNAALREQSGTAALTRQELSPEQREALRAMGYVQ